MSNEPNGNGDLNTREQAMAGLNAVEPAPHIDWQAQPVKGERLFTPLKAKAEVEQTPKPNGTLTKDIDAVIESLHRRIRMLEAFKATL